MNPVLCSSSHPPKPGAAAISIFPLASDSLVGCIGPGLRCLGCEMCFVFFLSPSCRGRCAEAAPLAAEEADPWARGPLCARLAALLHRGRGAGWGGGRRRRLQRRLCDAARAARAARLQGERYLEKIETLQPWLHFKNLGSIFVLPLKLGMAPVFSAPSGEMLMLKCHYSRQPRSGQCHSQRLDLLMGSVFPVAPPSPRISQY